VLLMDATSHRDSRETTTTRLACTHIPTFLRERQREKEREQRERTICCAHVQGRFFCAYILGECFITSLDLLFALIKKDIPVLFRYSIPSLGVR
jgi:hypothetical protein